MIQLWEKNTKDQVSWKKQKSATINACWFCPQKVQLKRPAHLLELADCSSW